MLKAEFLFAVDVFSCEFI